MQIKKCNHLAIQNFIFKHSWAKSFVACGHLKFQVGNYILYKVCECLRFLLTFRFFCVFREYDKLYHLFSYTAYNRNKALLILFLIRMQRSFVTASIFHVFFSIIINALFFIVISLLCCLCYIFVRFWFVPWRSRNLRLCHEDGLREGFSGSNHT